MSGNEASETLDQLTLEVVRLRRDLLTERAMGGAGDDLERTQLVRALEGLIMRHGKLRNDLESSPSISVSAQTRPVASVEISGESHDQLGVEELRREIDRLDARYRKLLENQRNELQRLSKHLEARVDMVEGRHEALLNGRIFGSLRRAADLARRIGLFRQSGRGSNRDPACSVPTVTVMSENKAGTGTTLSKSSGVTPLVPPEPKKLPPPDRVKLAGVPYMCRPIGGVSAPAITYQGKPLISVVMTCYNTEQYVEAAANSILSQTWPNLELIAIDDCSSDATRQRLESIAAHDSRLKVYCFGENRGTYWCKNFGITKAAGAVVTFMDSDDTSLPERIEEQFHALNHVGKVVSTCNHVRKDMEGKTISINGVVERVAYISQMVKRQVFDEIGYFDTVRTSADDEFLRRVRITYGRDAEVNVKKALYVALLREGSLTSDPENAINFVQDRQAEQSFLSPQRRHYAAVCSRWHEFLVSKGLRPYVPFPVVRRPFPAFGKLVVAAGRFDGNQVSACLASYPARREKLQAVVNVLLPQVDHLYVYLNEYLEIPQFLRHSRITVELGGGERNIRDNGKFYFMERVRDGYVFTVDDDINYPPDYVQTLIRKLEFYDRKAIVGLHGTIYAKPIRSFFKGRTLYHFEEALSRDAIVNQLGTGTVAFHTELFRPSMEWFKETGMADVWFAVETKKLNITHIAIERQALWLTPFGVEESTLFREFRKNDSVQTQAVRSVTPWKEIPRGALSSILSERLNRFGRSYGRLLPRNGLSSQGAAK